MSASYQQRTPERYSQNYNNQRTPERRIDRSPNGHASSHNKSGGFVGRENSPHKEHHSKHLCNICECVAPNPAHQCPPEKHSYPKNLKSTMRNDYDRIRGWINPNDAPNSFVPNDNFKKSKPLGDNYETIYKKDYLASAPAKQQNYRPEDRHLSTAPFIAESTYKDMTRSSNKPGYSPIKPHKQKPNPRSGFEDQTIY